MNIPKEIEKIKIVLKDFFEAFDKRWGSDYRNRLEDGEKYTGMITGEQQIAKERYEGEKPSEPFNQEIYDQGYKQGYGEGRVDGRIENNKQLAEFLDDTLLIPESIESILDLVDTILKHEPELELIASQRESYERLKEFIPKREKWQKRSET